VLLEQDPTSRVTLAAIFRTIHTIKGTSGFLGFDRLERLTHQGENLLSLLRDGVLVISEDMTTSLLAMVDAVRSMLLSVAQQGNDGTDDYGALVATLSALARNEPVAVAPSLATPATGGELPAAAVLAETPEPVQQPAVLAAVSPAETEGTSTNEARSTKVDSSIRVEVGLLDHLMNLVGELVLARNQLLAHSTRVADAGFSESTQRLNFITTELQEGVMKTRMQPVSAVWSKFPRVVRDLALACGKKVRLEMEGADTELDKTIIEAIKDPLTHIVRNSIDHGIESPDVRQGRGKPVEGTLLLRAFHEGGQVIMEITDDGGGIDPGRIRAKAIEKGLITPDQAVKMSDHDVIGLIFAAGFSTAEAVSNVSGRGVGMDVVRTNIEKIGGSVDVQSTVGVGTTLVVRIPLTLAIIPALLVGLGESAYAISQVNLVELVLIEASQFSQLEEIGDATVFRLRGKLLPVIDLADVLGHQVSRREDGRALNLVVLSAEGRQFGLIVDEVRDTQEIVVKPLGSHLAGIDIYAGTTIMGDGSVALILDAPGLAKRARIADERRPGPKAETTEELVTEHRESTQTLVVCEVGERRFAVPIALIDRLEELPLDSIEYAAGREVVQYRGGLLSIIRLSEVFGTTRNQIDPLPVLVHVDEGRLVGLAVDQIVDIVEEADGQSHNVVGELVHHTGIIGRRVTDLVDLRALVASTRPSVADLVRTGGWRDPSPTVDDEWPNYESLD
jgi:two-component system chemotaxis sensor kinase CheA